MTDDASRARCRHCGFTAPEHDPCDMRCPSDEDEARANREEIQVDDEDKTYRIRRFHRDDSHPDHHRVIATGLTLEEAQEHCQDESTHGVDSSGQTIWFDGYDEE